MARLTSSVRFPPRRLALSLALVAAALVLALTDVAAAHSILVESEPAPGEQVDALEEVRLHFASEIAPDGHAVVVVGGGTQVTASSLERADATTLVAHFDEVVQAGQQEIRWEVVAADGHAERGAIPVTVSSGGAEPPEAADPGEPEASTSAPTTAAPTTAAPTTTEVIPPLQLVDTAPASAERVSDLSEVRLDFSADLASGGDHAVVVRSSDDALVRADEMRLVEPTALVATFGSQLPDGPYEVDWRVEGLDGTVEEGTISVIVAAADARSAGLAPAAVAALVMVVVLAVGALAYRAWRRRPASA